MPARKKEVERLRGRARAFLDLARVALKKGYFDLASFNGEQYLQLTLKAELLELAGDYPRTHELRRLLRLIGEGRSSGDKAEAFIKRHVDLITKVEDAYVTTRYHTRDIEKAEAEHIIKFALKVKKFVKSL